VVESLEERRLFAANLPAEYQHIIDCQDLNASSATYGAINDVTGSATWIVPGEMAFAAMVLKRGGYTTNANLAAAFLARIQNADGSWSNQYAKSGTSVVVTDAAKNSRQTAQVVLALKNIGGSTYTTNANNGANWLNGHLVTAGTGKLIDGGLDASGNVLINRWASDNSFAAAAYNAVGYTTQRDAVVNGINSVLKTTDHWYAAVNGSNVPLAESSYTWVDFAPAFMNLKTIGVQYPTGAAQKIIEELQVLGGPDDGAVWENGSHVHYMPGIGFQAAVAIESIGEPDKAAAIASATVTMDTGTKHAGAQSIKSVLSAPTGSHGGTFRIKTITRSVDESTATSFSVWVKDMQGNNTVQLKLVDSSGAVSNAVWSATAATQNVWSKVSWNLSGFSGIDKAHIAAMEVYEWNNGTYYFDDATFLVGSNNKSFQDSETFAYRHDNWAMTASGLLQSTPDASGNSGGWIDWKDPVTGATAPQWQRFIDTSAYFIMAENHWTF